MRTALLSILLLLAGFCLPGCVEVDDDAMPDTVIIDDVPDAPEEVEIDVEVKDETP